MFDPQHRGALVLWLLPSLAVGLLSLFLKFYLYFVDVVVFIIYLGKRLRLGLTTLLLLL